VNPRDDPKGVVHAQRYDARASHCSAADEACAVARPSEVVLPLLRARVEEGNRPAGSRIQCFRSGRLGEIAAPAGKCEVFLYGQAAPRQGKDVFDLKAVSDDSLGCVAILASFLGAPRDEWIHAARMGSDTGGSG
jgi:hypothetical protein